MIKLTDLGIMSDYTKVYRPIIPRYIDLVFQLGYSLTRVGFYGFAKTNYTQEYGLMIHPPLYFKMCRFFGIIEYYSNPICARARH